MQSGGERVAGLKPIVSGVAEGGVYEDVWVSRAARVPVRAVEECVFYAFRPAIAPHFALARAGCTIDLKVVVRFVQEASRGVDRVVVEGAEGLLVPLTATEDFADLARALRPARGARRGLRLGAINHAFIMRRSIPDSRFVTSPFRRCR